MKISKQSRKKRVRRAHDGCDLGVHQRADDDRPHAVGLGRLVYARDDLVRFFHRIDEGKRHLLKTHALELSKEAVA